MEKTQCVNGYCHVSRCGFDVYFLLISAQPLNFCDCICSNLRSRWRARRLRNMVEPDRREITRQLQRDLSRGISRKRAWRELPARGRVLQESIWALYIY